MKPCNTAQKAAQHLNQQTSPKPGAVHTSSEKRFPEFPLLIPYTPHFMVSDKTALVHADWIA